MELDRIIQLVTNGLALGSLYALTTLGLAIVFGIARLLNFAYGEMIMVAGYVLWYLVNKGIPWLPAAIASVAVTVLLGIAMERVGFRPVRGADSNTLLITSFAISTVLQTAAMVYIWPRPVPITMPNLFSQHLVVGSVHISKLDILTIIIGIVGLGALTLFLKRSILGIALRAAAEDFTTTRLMGIPANAVIATAFAIEGLLAGIVMILWSGSSGVVFPTIGLVPVLIGFMAGTVGGMNSLVGAVLGGYLTGFLFTVLATVLPTGVQPFRQAILFAIVIGILMWRPQGLIRGAYQEDLR